MTTETFTLSQEEYNKGLEEAFNKGSVLYTATCDELATQVDKLVTELANMNIRNVKLEAEMSALLEAHKEKEYKLNKEIHELQVKVHKRTFPWL